MHQNSLGQKGEQLIADQLKQKGYTILARNYTKQGGEIDIIAQKDSTIAFVEVKTRYNPLFDSAQLIVPSKQKKLITVAKQYLTEHTKDDSYCRFDVALVEYKNGKEHITYIPDAFSE